MSLHNTSKLTLTTLSLLFRNHPHSVFLTPSERRFVRSMTTGTRNHLSSDRVALSLILGLFFAKIAILCV